MAQYKNINYEPHICQVGKYITRCPCFRSHRYFKLNSIQVVSVFSRAILNSARVVTLVPKLTTEYT